MKAYFLILIPFISACYEQSIKNSGNVESINIQRKINKDSLNMLLEKDEAIKKFGTPFKQERFLLDNMYGEFWGNIYYKYSENERQSKSIYIKEITWEKDFENYITIWYEEKNSKLIPKAYLIWNKESEF